METIVNAYAAPEAGARLKPFTYELGPIGSNDVDIEVLYSGLCHSDMSMINNDWGISSYPLVPGHEVVGKISKKGDEVTNLSVGEIVGLGWHSGYCESCNSCESGDHNLCSSAESTIVSHHGGFADKVRAKASSVVKIPEGMNLKTVGPLFCGGITVFNPIVQFDIQAKDKVAVVGIGGLGHIALKFLNAWGCDVTAFTSSESKKQEALEMGAKDTLNSNNVEEIQSAANRFDFIISTVNVKLDWNLFISTLKPKGRLHFVGATLEPLDIGVFPLIMGQRSVSGSPVGSPSTIAKMLEFAKLHKIEPIIEAFSMDQINEAMHHLQSGKARYRVVLCN